MAVFVSLFWILLGVLGVFAVILIITILRLNRELQQLGDDTESLLKRSQRTIRTVQLAVPVAAALRNAVGHVRRQSYVGEKRKDGKKK